MEGRSKQGGVIMMDHHEPATAIAIPSPSSAFVPCSKSEKSSEPKTASFGEEKLTNLTQNVADMVKITVSSPLHAEIHPGKKEPSTGISIDEVPATTVQVVPDITFPPKPVFPMPTNTSKSVSDFENKQLNQSSCVQSEHVITSLPVETTGCSTLSSPATTQAVIPTQAESPSMADSGSGQNLVKHSLDSLLPHVLTPGSQTSATNSINCVLSTSNSSLQTPTSTGFKTSVVSRNILKLATGTNVQQPTSSGSGTQNTLLVDPIPEVIPEFQTGKIDAKKFPARHFEFRSLVIGSWKYEASSASFFSSKTSRLKVIFSQKKFIYEFELRENPGIMTFYQKEKHMASIDVPFSSVVGLNIPKENPHQLLIEVNSPPPTYLGKQVLHSPATGCALPTKYDTGNSVDLTGGQILTVPYHQINLCSTNLRGRLEAFDPRFKAMLRTPIVIDPSKILPQQSQVKPVKHKNTNDKSGPSAPKRSRKPSSGSSSSGSEGICSCTTGCTSQRCKCVKTNGKCTSECKCLSCKNPLNILADNGVDVAIAKEDACLMQNIFKISDLGKLLRERKVTTPCCDVLMPFKDICVGLFECPECESEYQFSWCSFSLCDDECRPRNHCSICKRCGDYRDDHCSNCNKCYFAGSAGSFKCPCRDRFSFIDGLSSFLNYLVDANVSSDDDYY